MIPECFFYIVENHQIIQPKQRWYCPKEACMWMVCRYGNLPMGTIAGVKIEGDWWRCSFNPHQLNTPTHLNRKNKTPLLVDWKAAQNTSMLPELGLPPLGFKHGHELRCVPRVWLSLGGSWMLHYQFGLGSAPSQWGSDALLGSSRLFGVGTFFTGGKRWLYSPNRHLLMVPIWTVIHRRLCRSSLYDPHSSFQNDPKSSEIVSNVGI